MKKTHFSQQIFSFRGLQAPEKGLLVGYGAVIAKFDLQVPLPYQLSLISSKNRRYHTDKWQVFTPRHEPRDSLFGQLTFALKYEGLELGVFKSLFKIIAKEEVTQLIKKEPHSQYSRKIWFLYEWLMGENLKLPDLKNRSYIDLIDESYQYPGKAINSPRHRIRNNLPGTIKFCPLVRKTPKLEQFITKSLAEQNQLMLRNIHQDILTRAAAFLLLKDSKSSFAIESEYPPDERLHRWGRAIGQAGTQELTQDEILRLQQIIIRDDRFVNLGWRTQGGFVGIHDRASSRPIPDHISAKWTDIDSLMTGLVETLEYLLESNFEPVLAAAIISFGFVFIHPLEDGNGRLHRYLIHHVLSAMGFANKGLIFPVSTAILSKIGLYKEVLESYSSPLLDFIKWQPTASHNVEVIGETIDYYRYFDATAQAEFLYECVQETIESIIPTEIKSLKRYDQLKTKLDSQFEMPSKTVSLLIKFLEQNQGKLSERAKAREFASLEDTEIKQIEDLYQEVKAVE